MQSKTLEDARKWQGPVTVITIATIIIITQA